MVRFILDGTVACGKTTVLQSLEQDKRISVYYEPIESWKDLLDQFYSNPQKYALDLNLTCLKDLARRDSSLDITRVHVTERSIHSSFHVFAKLAREQGLLGESELQTLREHYHKCQSIETVGLRDTVFLFIDVDASVAIERMKHRGKSETLAEEETYFLQLVETYRRFYKTLSESGAAVYRINGSSDKDIVASQVKEIIFDKAGFDEKKYLK